MDTQDFRYKWWALIGLSLLSFTAFLDFTIVSTALPFIQQAFHASVLKLQWITNIYGMLVCIFQVISGRIGDSFGRRKIFYFGFLLFAIASLGAGLAHSIDIVIGFRALQGVAGAIVFTLGAALIPQAFPEKEHTRAVGIFSAFNGAGLAVGPFLGGLLITYLSWRWVFLVNIPIIIIGFICCSFSLKESPRQQQLKIDWWGFLLLAIGLGCFIYGLINGESISWSTPITWINIIIGIVALLALLKVEKKVAHPLLDLDLFKHKHTALVIVAVVLASLVSFTLLFFDPLYLRLVLHHTAMTIGIMLLAVPIMQVIVSIGLTPLIKRFGVFNLLAFSGVTGLITALLHAYFGVGTSLWIIIIAFLLMGYSWGIGNAGSIAGIMQSVKTDQIGGALGTVFTMWNLFNAIFLALSTVIFHSVGKNHGFLPGFHAMAWFVAAIMLIGLITSLILRK